MKWNIFICVIIEITYEHLLVQKYISFISIYQIYLLTQYTH